MRSGLKILIATTTFSGVIVLIYLIYFIFWYLPHQGGLPPLQKPVTNFSLDFKNCYNDDFSYWGNVFYTPTSSIGYEVFGEQKSNGIDDIRSCYFRYRDAISREWINCRVPIIFGTTTFSVNKNGVDFSLIDEYCGYDKIFGGDPLEGTPIESLTVDFNACFTGNHNYQGPSSISKSAYYKPTSAFEYKIQRTHSGDIMICYFVYRELNEKEINCRVPISVGTTTFIVNDFGLDLSPIEEYCGYENIFEYMDIGIFN